MSQSSTKTLVRRSRGGDASATERLFARLMTRLRRLAHGRLPDRARPLAETADIAQDAAFGVWRQLARPGVDVRNLDAYIRESVTNRIRDEARKVQRQPRAAELDSRIPSLAVSPLQQAMSANAWERYRAALAELAPHEREAIVARIELGYSYDDVATLLGKPSAAAARMIVNRGLERLGALLKTARP